MSDIQNQDQDVNYEPEGSKKNVADEGTDIVEDEDEAHATQVIANLREKLNKAVAEKQEYLEGWQRTKADFVNARKREEEMRKEVVKYAGEDIIMQLVPVLDSFTMAFSNKEAWEKVPKEWRVGVEYIYAQLMGALAQNNLTEFNPIGETFDPVKHVAVAMIPVTDQSQDHKVLEVIQKGYILNGKIIRPAHVKIGENTVC